MRLLALRDCQGRQHHRPLADVEKQPRGLFARIVRLGGIEEPIGIKHPALIQRLEQRIINLQKHAFGPWIDDLLHICKEIHNLSCSPAASPVRVEKITVSDARITDIRRQGSGAQPGQIDVIARLLQVRHLWRRQIAGHIGWLLSHSYSTQERNAAGIRLTTAGGAFLPRAHGPAYSHNC